MREIGSEFWTKSNIVSKCRDVSANRLYLLSGRTALDCICKDSHIKSVMLPSYCCDSMIEPFIRNRVTVRFYSVGADYVRYDFTNDCDAVLLIDYFGYIIPEMLEIARRESACKKTVIYDSTHRLTGNSLIEQYASYSICSYRKWLFSNFAVALKHTGAFVEPMPQKNNDLYLALREQASDYKSKYIECNQGEKDVFLALYREAEKVLDNDYVGYAGIPLEINESYLVDKRRKNADQLMAELSYLEKVHLWRTRLDQGDTPLFVPILLKDEDTRNSLREYLIGNRIYCPIHWPLSVVHLIREEDAALYNRELSLICDQRYGEDDMKRIIQAIFTWCKMQ